MVRIPTGELDGVPKTAYWEVVDNCYLCDMCYMTKCPYVPPHPFNLDFPHLMLRAKAFKYEKMPVRARDRVLSSTDLVGNLAGIPVISEVVNAVNHSTLGRKVLQSALGVHVDANVPDYHSRSYRSRHAARTAPALVAEPAGATRGKVALFTTCYCNRNEPDIAADLRAVFEHNGIPVAIAAREKCCGMPKLELGDLKAVAALKDVNIPELVRMVDAGYDIVAPIPSCVLMYKQELPLLFPGDPDVQKVKAAIYDPFEYLWLRHREGKLKTDFARELGKVSYHVPCHLRVQNIGLKTRDVLKLVPNTTLDTIERCSGHNGTYAVKQEFHDTSMKIGKPVMTRVENAKPDFYSSDCPMAGHQIESGIAGEAGPRHPLTLLRMAYGLPENGQ